MVKVEAVFASVTLDYGRGNDVGLFLANYRLVRCVSEKDIAQNIKVQQKCLPLLEDAIVFIHRYTLLYCEGEWRCPFPVFKI